MTLGSWVESEVSFLSYFYEKLSSEAFVMIMSFFCKESTAHFGIESGYDLLNLIPICVFEKPFKIE